MDNKAFDKDICVPSNDTISRQSAIDIVRKLSVKEVTPAYMLIDKADVMTELMMLPSAQPEQKKGKWVRYDGDWLKTMCKCSECGAMIDINEKYRNFFCYHCGARMDGEQDE